jgi:hypothetical protein
VLGIGLHGIAPPSRLRAAAAPISWIDDDITPSWSVYPLICLIHRGWSADGELVEEPSLTRGRTAAKRS